MLDSGACSRATCSTNEPLRAVADRHQMNGGVLEPAPLPVAPDPLVHLTRDRRHADRCRPEALRRCGAGAGACPGAP